METAGLDGGLEEIATSEANVKRGRCRGDADSNGSLGTDEYAGGKWHPSAALADGLGGGSTNDISGVTCGDGA